MAVGTGTALLASALIGLGTAADSAVRAKKGAKVADKAQDAARVDSAKQAQLAEEEMNRMNAKRPDISKMRSSNAMATKPSTMLTSTTGDTNMQLGKSTLLGG